ncbi:MAG: nucleotidyl transferase AbiEii/AbiGii toxin family protein [bacterium]|nr:nucleotidyl transferase AbiEii/AbiGii toxin family protein [bacterium]
MNSYYDDTLYPLQDKVLKLIDGLQTPFYLTGGTALSRCYFNHRYSDDLDFFVNKDSNFIKFSEQILSNLMKNFEVEVIIKSESYISIKVNKILKIDLVNDVQYRYGQLEKKKIFSKVDNVKNILSNKLSALISRDEAKDVVDIWVIAKNSKIDWKDIFLSANSKAVGIFPPDIAKRLIEFPIGLLERIKWVKDKKPTVDDFQTDLNSICDSFLATK